jgi:hypothetical protein
MMSQNRQAARDRVEVKNDYEVNLRAELQIVALHAKLDEARDKDLAKLAALLLGQEARLQPNRDAAFGPLAALPATRERLVRRSRALGGCYLVGLALTLAFRTSFLGPSRTNSTSTF